MRYLLGFIFMLSSISSFAQIEIETERDKDGNVIISAFNSSSVPYTLQFDFSRLQNLSAAGGGNPMGISNPGTSRVLTLKRVNSSQGTDFSYSYRYIKGNIYSKSKIDPLYLIPVKEGVAVRGVSMTHIENRLQPKEQNDMFVGVAFYLPEEVTIVAPRKGYISDMKMDYTAGKNDLDFARSENYIEIYHADGTLTQIKVLKAGSELVKIGQQVFPGDPLATSAGENYQNGRHVRVIPLRVSKDEEGKIHSEIYPIKFVLDGGYETIEKPVESTVIHPEEIITLEMTKKELKNRAKK